MARTTLIALMIVACAMGAHARVLLQDECSAVGPTNPTNGAYDCTLPKSLNDVCTATCDANYQGSTVTATCGGDGSWTYSSTACTPTPCFTEPAPPANGEFATACGTTNVDGTCAGRCSAGYDGTVSATCVLGGTWDVSGTCTLIQCEGSPNSDGTTFTCASSLYGDQCTGTCTLGYNSPGTPTATCGSDGQWRVENACIKNRCSGSPTTGTGAVFSCGTSSPINNVCTGKCSGKCKGAPPKSRCDINGNWGPVEGDCSSCTPSGRG